MIVVTQGVPKRGCTRAAPGGNRPSTAMEKKMRGCPIIITSITDDRPAMAPISTNVTSQSCPVASTPTAIGCGTPSCEYGTMPVKISETAT